MSYYTVVPQWVDGKAPFDEPIRIECEEKAELVRHLNDLLLYADCLKVAHIYIEIAIDGRTGDLTMDTWQMTVKDGEVVFNDVSMPLH